VTPTTHPHLVPRSWKSVAIPLLPLWPRVVCYRVKPYLTYCFLEGSQVRPLVLLKRSIKVKMSMEHWWKDTVRGKPKISEKTLSQCQFVHHKSRMDWSAIQPGTPWWESSGYTPWRLNSIQNYYQKFVSYLRENTVCPFTNRSMLWEPYRTPQCRVGRGRCAAEGCNL